MTVLRFGLRLPQGADDVMTDEAIAGLVGGRMAVMFQEAKIGSGVVVSAERYVDALLGPGVWVVVDADTDRRLVDFET